MSIKDKIKNAREDDWLTKDFTKEELAEIKRQVRERPTAEWILFDEDKNAYECSNCKEPFILIADTPQENNYNYCPNCGAKMKEREEEE